MNNIEIVEQNMASETGSTEETIQYVSSSGIRLHSKIAKLPASARDFVNQALADGMPYLKIIGQLDQLGHPGITAPNLSYWFRTGYRDYLRQQASLERLRVTSEAALNMVEKVGPDNFTDFSVMLASARMAKLLDDLDPEALGESISREPAHFFKLASLVLGQAQHKIRNAKYVLAREKHELQSEILRKANCIGTGSGGISPESIEKIQAALKLM